MPVRIKTDYPVAVRRRPRIPRPELPQGKPSRRSVLLTLAIVVTSGFTIWLYLSQYIDGPGPGPSFDYSWSPLNKTLWPQRTAGRRKPLPFCKGIFQNNPRTMQQAATYMKHHPRISISDVTYYHMLEDCDSFIKDRGYITRTLSDEEAKFPLAYDILMYKDVEQTERLLRAIYMPQNYYCLHVDKKSPSLIHKVMARLTQCFPNVFIASKLEHVVWASMSVLQADLNCMADLLKFKKWRYFINLTGQEMPLKSNRELVRILKAYDGANEIEGYMDDSFKQRYEYVHVDGKKTKRKNPPPPHHIQITHGAVHIIASRAFVEFAINDQKAKDFQQWLESTFIPDELYFSSLNSSPELNVPGAYKGPPTKKASLKPFLLRYKLWQIYDKCEGYWQRQVCIFSIHDLPKMIGKKHFFINKFELEYEPLALDCIEELVYNKTLLSAREDFKYDVSFYKGLAHVQNHVIL